MSTPAGYRDRREAGRVLAASLRGRNLGSEPIVLALPRGGVPVAAEVAVALGAPLEVFLVRKLGFPGHPELAMGAIASGGVQLLDEELIARAGVAPREIAAVIEREHHELRRREQAYRPEGPLELHGRPAVVVDDGLATGFTMRAAVAAMRRLGCSRLTVAVPVGAKATCEEFAPEADLLVCPLQPETFTAVGQWYENFSQTTDEEVHACLEWVSRGARGLARGGRS
jgi:putative phosphoribosyl transferase